MKNGISNKSDQNDIPNIPPNELEGFLSIAVIELPNQGLVGITHCPGRNHTDSLGRIWRRNLQQDLAEIIAWGADSVLTLLETKDFEKLGVPDIVDEMHVAGLKCYHLPIPDMEAPGVE
ncbi:MAG: hypothetical protein ACI845_003892, partial [Gammaproteobacteria bacterium]